MAPAGLSLAISMLTKLTFDPLFHQLIAPKWAEAKLTMNYKGSMIDQLRVWFLSMTPVDVGLRYCHQHYLHLLGPLDLCHK